MDALGGYKLEGLDAAVADQIKDTLTFVNPAYAIARRSGESTENIPQHILGYKEHNGVLIIPRYALIPLIMSRKLDAEEWDDVLGWFGPGLGSAVPLSRMLTLPRDYQERVVEKLGEARAECGDAGLALPCGFGKTFLALHYADMYEGRTLVVCPSNVKLQEWRAAITEHWGLPDDEIGWVQASKREWKEYPISVAMLKTLSMQSFSQEFLSGFDLVIWDEAHLCGAPQLSRALGRFTGVNLTLTATPGSGVRRKLIELHNGKNWIVDQQAPKVQVSAYFVRVPVPGYLHNLPWRMQKIRLAKTASYTQVAAENLQQALLRGRRGLVLSSHVDPLVYLYNKFPKSGYVIGASSLRNVADEDVRKLYPEGTSWKECTSRYLKHVKETCNPILATGLTKRQPGGVGMDVADLDAGVVLFPVSCPDMTQQLTGRWLRTSPDKKSPIIVVLFPNTDAGTRIAEKMARKMQHLGVTVNFKE